MTGLFCWKSCRSLSPAGVYSEPSTSIKFYAEYAYNGERPLKDPLVADAPALRGHNGIIGIRFGNIGEFKSAIIAWLGSKITLMGRRLLARFSSLTRLPIFRLQIRGTRLLLSPVPDSHPFSIIRPIPAGSNGFWINFPGEIHHRLLDLKINIVVVILTNDVVGVFDGDNAERGDAAG